MSEEEQSGSFIVRIIINNKNTKKIVHLHQKIFKNK